MNIRTIADLRIQNILQKLNRRLITNKAYTNHRNDNNTDIIILVRELILNIKHVGLQTSIKRFFIRPKTEPKVGGKIISIEGNNIVFYRGEKYINVRREDSRVIYNNYDDWKLVQSRKGKKHDFGKLWEASKYKQIRNWTFAGISKNERMLEVGFRDGFNLKYLQDKGIKVEGIEVNHDAVIAARELGCKVFEEDIQKHTHYDDKYFAVISACDVLEHCFSPEETLKEIHRILRDDGRVTIEIPFENKFNLNLIHGHSYLFYNLKTFKRLLKSVHFKIIKKDLKIRTQNLFLLKKR